MPNKYLDNVIYGDSCEVMEDIPSNSIQLTVTSPPYDTQRNYTGNSYTFNTFMKQAEQLHRITKQGGVVVWVVRDEVKNGSESGTSFKQALYFKKIGFDLHDTMIWIKTGQGAVGSIYSYWQNFEYMFVFSKGKPQSINLIKDRQNKIVGEMTTSGGRDSSGISKTKRKITSKQFGIRFNTWVINQATNKTHKAVFPEKLAEDHIISWSNKGDLILDPFLGSGTTLKMAELNSRNWIGFEISEEYCKIAEERLRPIKCKRLGNI